MNWLKRTLGICALSVSLLFSGFSVTRAETLEIVFKSSLWGSAIGGVSGIAFWALQEEDKEDKFFPKYVVKGMALGLFVGMGFGIYDLVDRHLLKQIIDMPVAFSIDSQMM